MTNGRSILSYSQNFEDVLLWRALRHVQNGAYVDIGAQDPVVDSVSKAFYLRGWRGVNVDPNVTYADALRNDRPEDLVIQAAVGTSQDPITFFCIRGTGLSTGIALIAEEHRQIGYEVDVTTVPVVTLASVLRSVTADDIHWLKIDVEGMEADVLDSWGECNVRPWILVIEATHPNSQRKTEAAWVQKVSVRGYHEVHFDGLSRFFVSDSHSELDAAFETPPNVFDAFQVASHHFSVGEICREHENDTLRLQAAAAKAAEAATQARTASAKLLENYQHVESQKQELERAVQALTFDREHTATLLDERTSAWARDVASLQAKILLASEKCDRYEKLLHEERQTSSNTREKAAWTIAALVSRVESGDRNAVEWAKREEAARKQFSELTDKHIDSVAGYERLQAEVRVQLERADKELSARLSAWELDRIEWEDQIFDAKQKGERLNALLENARQELARKSSETDATIMALTSRISESESVISDMLEQIALSQQTLSKLYDERKQLLLQSDKIILNLENTKAGYEALVCAVRQQRSTGLAGRVRRMASKLGLYDMSSWERDISVRSSSYLARNKGEMKHFREAIFENSEVSVDSTKPASNLQSLLSLSGVSFLRCAYLTLLGRLPDPDGENYYISRLRSGWTKASILSQLRSSREGRRYKVEVDGLSHMIARHRRTHLPLVGWIFRAFYDQDGDSTMERAVRRVNYSVIDMSIRLDEVVTSTENLRSTFEKVTCRMDNSNFEVTRRIDEVIGLIVEIENGVHHNCDLAERHYHALINNQTKAESQTKLYMTVEDILKIAE
ncbi:FkbM family methyltransferase [Novosphingobium sp. 9U]|uniref:FkbM family methyltransferase n=1 Tax=Novosphingobium sp. 9U TaxID=2653158 RepID=UPI0012F220C1|nr:FkbM family methyltransferase [Novosphingobium sp. 9U]VWX53876.1 conserved hypothetical protein [Novosphingobium sp. 9U]